MEGRLVMSAYVRAKQAYLREMNKRYPAHLVQVPRSEWPIWAGMPGARLPIEVWRSQQHLLMVYLEHGYERLSIVRTALAGERYAGGISWDDLQRLKRECGRGDRWAVEIYPPEEHLINVQNMRHLWVLDAPPPYGWKKDQEEAKHAQR